MKKNNVIFTFSLVIFCVIIILLYTIFLSGSFNLQHKWNMVLFICFIIFGICYVTDHFLLSKQRMELIHCVKCEKNEKILEGILEISDSILTIKDRQQLFDLILEKAVACIDDAKMGSLLIINDHQELEYKAMEGYDLDRFKNLSLQLEETFLYRYNHGDVSRACIIRNVQEFNKKYLNRTTYEKMHQANAFITKAAICAPIKIDNKFYGIINVDSDNLHGFTDTDLSFMEYFATQISTVIKNHEILERMMYLSRYDHLTGIFNRYYFEEIFERMFSRAEMYQETLTLIMFDLDNLKITNDTFGHQIGDRLIQQFALGLKENTRKSDTIARYGGDEFIAACPFSSAEDVEKIIHKLNTYFMENPLIIGEVCIYNKFSYGAAHYPTDGKEIKTLLKIADDRMYANKDKHKMKIPSTEDFSSQQL